MAVIMVYPQRFKTLMWIPGENRLNETGRLWCEWMIGNSADWLTSLYFPFPSSRYLLIPHRVRKPYVWFFWLGAVSYGESVIGDVLFTSPEDSLDSDLGGDVG